MRLEDLVVPVRKCSPLSKKILLQWGHIKITQELHEIAAKDGQNWSNLSKHLYILYYNPKYKISIFESALDR